MNRVLTVAVLSLTLLTTLSSSGCFKGEEDTCEYWGERLQKSADIDRALRKVSYLKCKDAMPTLEQLYADGQFQDRILVMIKEIDDRAGAVNILKMALRSSNNAKLAATIIADWKLEGARDELLKILADDAMAQNRGPALEALLSFDKPNQHEDLLVSLAGYNANIQGFEVNRTAIENLGKIKSAKARDILIRMAFLRTNKGFEVYQSVRPALAQIGGVADKLIAIASAENAEIKEYARSIGVQDWEWRAGPKTFELLASTLDPKVGPILVKSLTEELAAPAGVSDKAIAKWSTGQKQRTTLIMNGLGALGTEAEVPGLAAIVKDSQLDTVNQRVKAATCLAMIGTDSAQQALLDAWINEPLDEFQAPLVKIIALAIDHKHMPAFDAAMKKARPYTLAALKDAQTLDRLGVVRECSDDAACVLSKLAGDKEHEIVKAATLLSRGNMGGHEAVQAALWKLFDGATAKQTDRRRFALNGIIRLADAQTSAAMLSRADKMGDEDKYWKNELFTLGHALTHLKK